MNREIKFRAWDIPNKEMLIPDVIEFGDYVGFTTESGGSGVAPIDTVVLMQYTGLKDKNGVEIYEGDIVRSNPDGYGDRNCVVVYLHNRFTYTTNGMPCVWEFHRTDEVIGNIHENPELLEAK